MFLNCSNNIVHDDAEKAEAFNTFSSSQSNIDDTDKSVPADDTVVTRISTSLLHWFDAISIWLLNYQNKVLFVYELC
jgi:hypothetical protein